MRRFGLFRYLSFAPRKNRQALEVTAHIGSARLSDRRTHRKSPEAEVVPRPEGTGRRREKRSPSPLRGEPFDIGSSLNLLARVRASSASRSGTTLRGSDLHIKDGPKARRL